MKIFGSKQMTQEVRNSRLREIRSNSKGLLAAGDKVITAHSYRTTYATLQAESGSGMVTLLNLTADVH
jgi:integrase